MRGLISPTIGGKAGETDGAKKEFRPPFWGSIGRQCPCLIRGAGDWRARHHARSSVIWATPDNQALRPFDALIHT